MKHGDSAIIAKVESMLWPALGARNGLRSLVAPALVVPDGLASKLGLIVREFWLFTMLAYVAGMTKALPRGSNRRHVDRQRRLLDRQRRLPTALAPSSSRPLVITMGAIAGTLAASYAMLALSTFAATLQLQWTPRHDRP